MSRSPSPDELPCSIGPRMRALEIRTERVEDLLLEMSWRGVPPTLWAITVLFALIDAPLFLILDLPRGWVLAVICWTAVAIAWGIWIFARWQTLTRMHRQTPSLRGDYEYLSRLYEMGPKQIRDTPRLEAVLNHAAAVLSASASKGTI